jgi:hypothetical protein
MKMKLAVALAVLFFANAVRADNVDVDSVPVFIPDGSTITSVNTDYQQSAFGPLIYVGYSFADGTGYALGNPGNGFGGEVNFTTPVSGLTFGWTGYQFLASDNAGDGYVEPYPIGTYGSINSEAFTGAGITQIIWSSTDTPGGIASLTYTLDSAGTSSVPEPSSLLLSGIGLAALIGLVRRNRKKGQKAMV